MRQVVGKALFFCTLFFSVQFALAQKPQVCDQRLSNSNGLFAGNDNDLVVTVNGQPKICLPPNTSSAIVRVQPPNNEGLGFVFNPTAQFNADSLASPKYSPSNEFTLADNLEGVIWVVHVQPQTNAAGGRIIRCKSIEVVRQKQYSAQITPCTETSGIFQIIPASTFANTSARLSIVGPNVRQEVNMSQLGGQSINFLPGTNIENFQNDPGLIINEVYLFSDRINANCPQQFVRVSIETSERTPRIVSLDRSLSDEEVELRIENISPNTSFDVERGPITGGPRQIVDDGVRGNPLRVPMGDQQNACFAVSFPSVCVPTARLTSNVVCSTWLEGELEIETPTVFNVKFTWTIPNVNLNRQLVDDGTNSYLLSPSATQYELPSSCFGPFTFSLRQRFQTNEGISVEITSNTLKVDPASNLTAPTEKLFVSMAQNADPRVEVVVADALVNQTQLFYFEQKLGNETTFGLANPTKNASFSADVSADPAGLHCFRYGREICGIKSPPSQENCVLQNTLEPDYVLAWKAFDGNPTTADPPVYDLEYANKETDPNFLTPGYLSPTRDLQTSIREMLSANPEWTQFLVRVYTQNTINGLPSYAYPVEVLRPLALHLPNAFTPNGDGTNDTFRISNPFSGTGFMRIYNRIGQIVFATEDIEQGWNGQNNKDRPLPAGMYQYQVEVTNTEGQTLRAEGNILLIR